ncbi:hypothetical protein NDU88_004724 [Pleurodeles waltl]|uniref:Uncharacterized protein n=1 Tax=Pleurodeles waltl TaxID=8319 RepID=A0AAV7SJL5_PLEWA|nr:hypothetical protein NDU88_004724 [Pleurodeles waltl]
MDRRPRGVAPSIYPSRRPQAKFRHQKAERSVELGRRRWHYSESTGEKHLRRVLSVHRSIHVLRERRSGDAYGVEESTHAC